MEALERANQVRRARSELKRKIEHGELSVLDVLVACPAYAETMAVRDLLMSQKWWGKARSRRLLVSIGIPETKPVGTLSERQKMEIAALLSLRASRARRRARAPFAR